MAAREQDLSVDSALERLLAAKGYALLQKIGEGHTREVYLVEYRSGSLVSTRVAKIPKTIIDDSSLMTRINLAKGDLDEREVRALNGMKHPHLVEIYDAFKLGARTMTVEEYYDAVSLEDLVRLSGPVTDPFRFGQIFIQVEDALRYLHTDQQVLHRDIKPSNILVGKGSRQITKIADLQNVGSIDEAREIMLPTRGGTAYTDPRILNALLQGDESTCTLQSEFYALGATMFYALMGKAFSELRLETKEGSARAISLEGRQVGFALVEDGQEVSRIDSKEHDFRLLKKLKEVPRRYRKLLWNCLSLEHPKYTGESAHDVFRDDLERAIQVIPINWKKVKVYTGLAVAAGGLAAGIIVGVTSASLQKERARLNPPSVLEMLGAKEMPASGIEFVLDERNVGAAEALRPYFAEVKEKLVETERTHAEIFGHRFKNDVEVGAEIHRISRRLAYSIIRSVLMGGEDKVREAYGYSRAPESAVPYDFVSKVDQREASKPKPYPYYVELEPHRAVGLGMYYVKQFITVDLPIPEVVAAYFENHWKINRARIRSGSDSVLPQCVEQNFGCKPDPGYGRDLNPAVRDFIYRTLALYYLTDETGKVHFNVLDSSNKPIKGLAAR